jgi:hypothetical protein
MNSPKRSEAEPRDGNDLESLAAQYKDSGFFEDETQEPEEKTLLGFDYLRITESTDIP